MEKFNFTLHTGFAGCTHEDTIELDLEGLKGEEREAAIEEEWKDWAWNYLDGGWEEA
ncbi:hypothetical protein D3C76_1843640 [compost metagenome]